ncbi:hypothetical protein [Fulvivirga sedimenti]|uniref:DUF748 domain-containing protein n=1 Tax=Fulvivirga sedimenti TaxID=2879465 RepID=A0A9X1HT49_9BACT|nr:hypothetical protein [Fulvivirga sedimenti]MCA6075125.1 hypothetical protein [Fulvivirga sedimenti]MCA6076302.1 hypothetical protein [Fulvivirga sedimenti]MCA6077430.1 hypothetical protein [Fulvivirga sedimenti]
MITIGKKIGIIILITITSIVLLHVVLGFWIENRLEDLLNNNTEGSYQIGYSGIDLHSLFNGATIERLEIKPNTGIHDQAVSIYGTTRRVEINGLQWMKLLTGKTLQIKDMILERPEFTVYISTDTTRRREPGKSFQNLFKNIISAAELQGFYLESGRVKFLKFDANDTIQYASIDRVDIEALNIETDSVIMSYIIPFQLGRIKTHFAGIQYQPDEFSIITADSVSFDSQTEDFSASNVSMKLTNDWIDVSRQMGDQQDIIEFDLKKLKINNLVAKSTLYDTLDIEASSIYIDSLILKDHRNKNIPRKNEPVKPLFAGMIRQIPFPLNVDSVVISNSHISYTELGEGRTEPGTLQFGNLNGRFSRITTSPAIQGPLEKIEATISGNINGNASIQLELLIPYEDDRFYAHAKISNMNALVLNKTIMPLADVRISSGKIHGIELTMDANSNTSGNSLNLDYENLGVELLIENKNDPGQRYGFLSGLFNTAIRQNNLPSENGYKSANYVTTRNLKRGPFNFMWQSIKEGMVVIIPSNTASLFINKSKK